VAPAYVPVHEQVAQAGLFRPLQGRAVAGVCAGFAQRYGWDVTIVRLLLVLGVLLGGAPLIAYIIAWIVMPNEPYFAAVQPVPPVQQQGQPQG
jgi:phage shock protein PspC (stress-responsive transcriptional regulator)